MGLLILIKRALKYFICYAFFKNYALLPAAIRYVSDDKVIDSGSSLMRLIVNAFEHVTPFDPHKTFCIVTLNPSPLVILPFDNMYVHTP
jgi:hypothetical protein